MYAPKQHKDQGKVGLGTIAYSYVHIATPLTSLHNPRTVPMQELADGLYPFAVAAAFGSGWVERGGLLFQDSGDAVPSAFATLSLSIS
jgi:hypothetical protein